MAREVVGLSTLFGLGASSAAVLVIGMVVGWFVDHLLSTSPLFLIIGLALGIVGASAYMISQFRRYTSE